MAILKNRSVLISEKEEFEKQGLKIVNIKFIDDETSIFITRKKERSQS